MENVNNGTFWEHLDVLRFALLRSLIVVGAFSVLAFCFKDFVFDGIIFYPVKSDFFLFGLFDEIPDIKIINTKLSAQLFIHLSVSFYLGLTVSVPYILGEIWFFLKPALYQNERSMTVKALVFMTLLFYCGVLVSYFLIFPLSVNFLANYQVTSDVENLIDLDSYIDTLTGLVLSLGLVFELPVLAYFLSKIGILTHDFMKKRRKHAFVLVLILAAIITPSTDIFTLLLTALPLQAVYELSAAVVKRNEKC